MPSCTPETILALPDPGDAMPYVKAMWRYSRGIAAQRNFDAAMAEVAAIAALEGATDFSLLKASGVPGEEVMRLARAVIQGRVAQAQGNLTVAIARFAEAAVLRTPCHTLNHPTGIIQRAKRLRPHCCRRVG
jgi:hypothetical protein